MKKRFLVIAIAAGLTTSAVAQAEVKVKWFGFAQITGQMLDQNSIKNPSTDGAVFGADRVRFGFKIKDGNVFGKLQADLNSTDKGAKEGSLPQIIKDMAVGYKFSKAAKVTLGQFKTPVGMDFNTSGKKLDITKRGMEKKFVLERTAGIMLSGRKIAGGFGYDIFYGNPSGRSAAIDTGSVGTTGADNTTAIRVMYDMGKMMHIEYATGTSGNSAVGGLDYKVNNLGFRFKSGPTTVKFEWIDAADIRGTAGRDETTWYLHYGHMMNKTTELIFRHYNADADAFGGNPDTSLANTYLGVNFFLGSSKTNGRIQVNYVLTGGDDGATGVTYAGIGGGYTDTALLAQYQVSF
jgi:hypothetical protein